MSRKPIGGDACIDSGCLLEFKGAADTRKWLDDEFAALKTAMTALGLVRQP